eukprot:4823434-Prorocentrum_lima.AAC.1
MWPVVNAAAATCASVKDLARVGPSPTLSLRGGSQNGGDACGVVISVLLAYSRIGGTQGPFLPTRP